MKKILIALVLGVFSITANAALVSVLGGQAVYDTDRDISWAGDGNLVASNTFGLSTGVNLGPHPSDSSGADGIIFSSGITNWPGALFWIDAMNAASYLGFNDWRLPTTLVPDSSCTNLDGTLSADSTGFDCTGGEMGHLFYDEFNAIRTTIVLNTGDPNELTKFTNIGTGRYWSGTEFATDQNSAWVFRFNAGLQESFGKVGSGQVWAVRDGNVVVPVPAAVWLFGSALGLLGWIRRNKA